MLYKDAGVDVDKGEEAVRKMEGYVQRTFTPNVISGLGTFAGLYRPDLLGYRRPVLAASIDGVGTKMMVAQMAGVYNTVGWDLVSHCINDLLAQGALPLFLLDYIAGAKLDPEIVAEIVRGIGEACQFNHCVLLGGETAEMPGVYEEGQYDLVGSITGIVREGRQITGKKIRPGDKVLGIASSGLHTNGYSLARMAIFEIAGHGINDELPWGNTVRHELLAIHCCYEAIVKRLLSCNLPLGMAHVTGGGIPGNLVRVLPKGCKAVLDSSKWKTPPIFPYIKKVAEQPDYDYFKTFNTGVGFLVVVRRSKVKMALEQTQSFIRDVWEIGEIVEGERSVIIN